MEQRKRQQTNEFRNHQAALWERRRGRQSGGGGAASAATVSEAAEIQRSLRHTQTLLQGELDRVARVSSAIEDDGKVLRETMQDQQTMDVAGAKKALSSLERAQQMEHRILMAALAFFWTVVCYILCSRILLHLPFVDRIPILNML